jgi:gamma-glutamylcyclotransferase (GGCT)/AIG2-like uncharacterized protein YtfP
VYGTLRKEYGLKLMQEVADKMTFIGLGRIKAAFYDLGSYPAAVKNGWQNSLRGDVYKVEEPNAVFAFLDQYEGEEYQREKTAVYMEAGEEIEAFVYWFTGKTDEALLIEEADYLYYLKNKKDRFV